ncbi:secretion protein [Pandoraea cepalis]|uniref:Secretion protein n=1 Tax=Pandoraea cepalis TaxID=2508294 RepID=A0AAW7MT02_9BURK|nr:secretion protein [Pandoraea cepalis]MDN4581100.1 secretion protein [Pandoraea cepalis]
MFRNEALAAGRPRWLGDVLLTQSVPVKVAIGGSIVLAGAVVALLAFGTYTHRVTVVGHLVPASGIVKVHPMESGTVVSRIVSEGQRVNRDDVLYVISAERTQRTGAGLHASVAAHITSRLASIKLDIDEMKRLHLLAQHEQRSAIAARADEVAKLDALMQNQRDRVALSKVSKERYERLLAQSFVSGEQAQEKHAEYLEQRARLGTLQRERVTAVRALTADSQKLEAMPLAQQRELARGLRDLATVEQELAESEGKREFAIISPVSGVATAVVADVGQNVGASAPVVSIMPVDVPLEAHLYVRSNAVGFIRAGDRVRLRYRAFAHQKFGHFRGTVISVSGTALPNTDIVDVDLYEGRFGARVPVYLVKVSIADSKTGQGETLPLRAGMVLDADIMRETRRLYEWAFHPLKSMGGSI